MCNKRGTENSYLYNSSVNYSKTSFTQAQSVAINTLSTKSLGVILESTLAVLGLRESQLWLAWEGLQQSI